VGKVVACIHPVGIHGAQILDLQLDQRTSQLGRVSQFVCEFIGLELIATAQDVHQELDDGIHWCKGVGEENESDYDREFLVEAKGFVKGSVVDEYREEGEDVEEMGLKELIKACLTQNSELA
jgi:hypothetical protein